MRCLNKFSLLRKVTTQPLLCTEFCRSLSLPATSSKDTSSLPTPPGFSLERKPDLPALTSPEFKKGEIWTGGRDEYLPVSRVSLVLRAGARYEHHKHLGVTHAIRASVGLSASEEVSSFRLIRDLMHHGANLTCTTTREHIIYSLDIARDYLHYGLFLLNEATKNPQFKTWEWKDVEKCLAADVELLKTKPQIGVVELLHDAAYREIGLGRSLNCPEHRMGKITPETIHAHMDSFYTPSQTALLTTGCPTEVLDKINGLFVRPGSGGSSSVESSVTKYRGGERRCETGSETVHSILASNGLGLNAEPKQLVALGILQRILGCGPRVNYGRSETGRLSKALSHLRVDGAFTFSAINLNYSDSGLFGFHVVSDHQYVGRIWDVIVRHMKDLPSQSISDEELSKAKAQYLMDLRLHNENQSSTMEDWASQLISKGKVISSDEIQTVTQNVTAQDVIQASKAVLCSKLSMATIGNLSHTPFVDDLI